MKSINREEPNHYSESDLWGLINRSPQWIIHWGTLIILIVIVLFFTIASLIKYPDIEKSSVILMTDNIPIHVSTKITGKIDTIFICDSQIVKSGDALVLLKNPAKYEDIKKLKFYISEYRDLILSNKISFALKSFDSDLSLGDLQVDYNAFIKSLEAYKWFIKDNFYSKKIKTLEKKKRIQEKIARSNAERLNLLQENLLICEQSYHADSILFQNDAITITDYENSIYKLLQMKQYKEEAIINSNTTFSTIAQLEHDIWELHQEEKNSHNTLYSELSKTYNELSAKLEAWEHNYLLRTPIDGRASVTSFWHKDQYIIPGEILLSIIPTGEKRIIGKMLLRANKTGKFKVGQSVNVKFEGFPSMEYGIVHATINKISLVPIKHNENLYIVTEVIFPDELMTNYGFKLPFSQEMQGEADIITEQKSILKRIFNPLKYILKNEVSK